MVLLLLTIYVEMEQDNVVFKLRRSLSPQVNTEYDDSSGDEQ